MIAIVLVVLGALVGVSTVGWAAVGAAAALAVRTSEVGAPVGGVTALRVDVSAADLLIVLDPSVSEATLSVTGRHGADRWTLERAGATLMVAAGDLGIDGPFDAGDVASLRLPASLEGIDADLRVDAGDLDVDGAFGELSVTVGAGDADLAGSATALAVEVDGGDVEVDLVGVDDARLAVRDGDLDARLAGGQPDSVSIEADAADVEVEVPTGAYRLTGDAADPELVDTDLISDPGADSTIAVRTSASDVSVQASR